MTRAEIAEKFLAAWLTSSTGIIAGYHDGEMMLKTIIEVLDDDWSGMPSDRLGHMAEILEQAAKGHNEDAA